MAHTITRMATTGPLLAAIASELRAEMGRQKLANRELARISGIPYNTQARYLSGDSPATPDDLEAIAHALGTDLFAVLAIVAENQSRNANPKQPSVPQPRPRRRASDITPDTRGVNGGYLALPRACRSLPVLAATGS